jgi:hypothetical protein
MKLLGRILSIGDRAMTEQDLINAVAKRFKEMPRKERVASIRDRFQIGYRDLR